MDNQQEWGESRWDFTKEKSNWHFDPTIVSTDYTSICTFNGEWEQEVAELISTKVVPSTWATRNKLDIPGKLYSASKEEYDLTRAGANPDMEIFNRTVAHEYAPFKAIADYFGMEEATIKFHNQTTGQQLVWHIDNFAGRKERGNSFVEIDADKNPEQMRRFAIMLDDWKHGQVFQLGNSNWHQWKKGQCITWEWQDVPHATCNMGWNDRPMLQVTGLTTSRTRELVKSGSFSNVVDIGEH
mgnify:FL=1